MMRSRRLARLHPALLPVIGLGLALVAGGCGDEAPSDTSGSTGDVGAGGLGGGGATSGGGHDGGMGGSATSTGGDDTPIDPLDACRDDLAPELGWFETESGLLLGTIEFGQTHVIGADEQRHAPPLIEGREAMMLFTPDTAMAEDSDVRVAAFYGDELLGVLSAAPPSALPPPLEQRLTSTPLSPYSTSAWSVFLPWSWVREGVTLKVGHGSNTAAAVHELVLSGLGAPQRFTITRTKIVLFGESDYDTTTTPATQIAHDFFASVPAASLRVVDVTPWRLDEVVVPTADGPRLVASEDERLALTTANDRYPILKHQLSLRHSLANTGRGLAVTEAAAGDGSPYSFGSSVALGWVRNGDGSYSDIHNGGAAGGWTGWSAIWANECGNIFIHEVGHSMTLSHFGAGKAINWGIADEYPQDGVNLATHPWGYHSLRRQPRTWYGVNSDGAMMDADGVMGKHDPMNGGHSPNKIGCYPQYTAYQAEQAQDWMESAATLANINGVAGAWQWNAATRSYDPATIDPAYGTALEVDVPVVTIVGTLGNVDSACQSYPPMFASSGNVFTMPEPTDANLASDFVGAHWFLEITYADNSVDRALIARGEMLDNTLALYSLNLPVSKQPTKVDLYRTLSAYPAVDVATAQLVHSRAITIPAAPLPAVVSAGQEWLANGALKITSPCDPSLNCQERAQESSWRVSTPLHFTDASAPDTPGEVCTTPNDVMALQVAALRDNDTSETIVVHAQRVMQSGNHEVAVPLNDVTPWLNAADTQQTLRVWIPYEENKALLPGHYTSQTGLQLQGSRDGIPFSVTPVSLDFVMHDTVEVDLATEFVGTAITATGSSVFFVVQDPAMGPESGIWWGSSSAASLTVPMIDESTNAVVDVKLDALKQSCNQRWTVNAAQAAWDCSHAIVLNLSAVGNEQLISGHTYRSPGVAPLVMEGRRWHQPNAQAVVETFAYRLLYSAP